MEKLNNSKITPFPIQVFPSKIIDLLIDANNTLNFPIEYFASAILSASSVAIGNTYQVQFMESWIEKPILFMVLVGSAGDIKSHPLKFAFKPIDKVDANSYSKYSLAIKEYNQRSSDEKNGVEKPTYKKFLLNDFTPESLIKIHTHNNRGIAIFADELSGWIKNFGRYNKSSEQETYLSLWNGTTISVDRKGDEPIRLENPCVNVIGTIQTKVLPDLAKENRDSNGFIPRFLFSMVENPKPLHWNSDEINRDRIANYNFLIEKLFALDFIDFTPNTIKFSEKAKQYIIEWQNNKRTSLRNDEIGTEIQAKYEVYAIRFSLIIQLMYWAMEGKQKDLIELFAVEKAIILIDFYFETAIKVHNKIYNIDPLTNLSNIQKKLYDSLGDEFTTAQAINEGGLINIPERTVKRFLLNKQLFYKQSHGVYRKV